MPKLLRSEFPWTLPLNLIFVPTSTTLPPIFEEKNEFIIHKSQAYITYLCINGPPFVSSLEKGWFGNCTVADLKRNRFGNSCGDAWMTGEHALHRGTGRREASPTVQVCINLQPLADPQTCLWQEEQASNWEPGGGRTNDTAAMVKVIYFSN